MFQFGDMKFRLFCFFCCQVELLPKFDFDLLKPAEQVGYVPTITLAVKGG